jgi:hypothetical protein
MERDTKIIKLGSPPRSQDNSRKFSFQGILRGARFSSGDAASNPFQPITKSLIGNANSLCFRSIISRNFAAPAFSTTVKAAFRDAQGPGGSFVPPFSPLGNGKWGGNAHPKPFPTARRGKNRAFARYIQLGGY